MSQESFMCELAGIKKVYDDVLLVNRISAQLEKFFLPKTIKLYAQITIVLLPSPKAEWIKRVFFRIKEDFKSSISGGLDPWVLLSMDFKVSPHKENVLKIFSLIFIACLYVCGGGYHFLLFALPSSWRTVRKLKMY